jgi:hypothetical protein
MPLNFPDTWGVRKDWTIQKKDMLLSAAILDILKKSVPSLTLKEIRHRLLIGNYTVEDYDDYDVEKTLEELESQRLVSYSATRDSWLLTSRGFDFLAKTKGGAFDVIKITKDSMGFQILRYLYLLGDAGKTSEDFLRCLSSYDFTPTKSRLFTTLKGMAKAHLIISRDITLNPTESSTWFLLPKGREALNRARDEGQWTETVPFGEGDTW